MTDFEKLHGTKTIINLAQMSLRSDSTAYEPAKRVGEIVQPEDAFELTNIDTKPRKPKHYDPKNLDVSKFCNIVLEGGVCLAGEQNEMNRFLNQNDLILNLDFNQEINVDLSGSKLTVNQAIKAGPGVDEKGASAFFNGINYVTVDHYDKWDSKELRVSFWIYVIETTKNKETRMYCPLILKGSDDFTDEKFNRYPGIFIQENTRKLRAFVSLENSDKFRDVVLIDGRVFGQKVSVECLCRGGHTYRLLSTVESSLSTSTGCWIPTRHSTEESSNLTRRSCSSEAIHHTQSAVRWPTTSTI